MQAFAPMRSRHLTGLATLAAGLVLLVAAPLARAAEPTPDEKLARASVLQSGDLPGWTEKKLGLECFSIAARDAATAIAGAANACVESPQFVYTTGTSAYSQAAVFADADMARRAFAQAGAKESATALASALTSSVTLSGPIEVVSVPISGGDEHALWKATVRFRGNSGQTKGAELRFVVRYLAVRRARAVVLAFLTGDFPQARVDSVVQPLLARISGRPVTASSPTAAATLPPKGEAKAWIASITGLYGGKDEQRSGTPSMLTINKSDAAFFAAFKKGDRTKAAALTKATAALCNRLADAIEQLAPSDPTLVSINRSMANAIRTMARGYSTYASGLSPLDTATLKRGDALLDAASAASKESLLRIADLSKQLGLS